MHKTSTRMLLAWALAAAGVAPAAAGTSTWFPEDEIFRTPVAANAEAVNYLSFVQFDVKDPARGEDFSGAFVSVGLEFPFYRLSDSRWGGDWQLGFFADFQSQFNMSERSDPLANTDYFVGFPLSFRNQRWSARARLLHQSSHLGEQRFLTHEDDDRDDPDREDLSYEAADLLVAYTLPSGWRLYAGGTYIISTDLPQLGSASGHSGIDYLAPRPNLWGGRLRFALDMLSADAFDPDIQWHLLAGLRYGPERAGANGVTVGLQAFDGPIPFGQFFNAEARFYGVILLFDLG